MSDKFLNKKVVKQTVRDLKEVLKDANDDAEIVLCFNLKDGEERVVSCYLAEVMVHLKYDSVLGEKLNDTEIVELNGYNDRFCTYVERK